MASLNVPGMHLHFLSQDRQEGGHLLECQVMQVKVEIQILYTLELSLPHNLDYLTWIFNGMFRGIWIKPRNRAGMNFRLCEGRV